MLQNVSKLSAFGFVIIMVAVAIFAFAPHMSQGQAEEVSTLRAYLTDLRDNRRSAYIGLISPIDENPGWAVPEDFTNDAGEIITRRIIGEVGEDFVCIDSIGQGFTVTSCIPFTNIAFIRRPAP